MKRKLYSELRTIYETTAADPHTFRITIKLKDPVDGGILRSAVDKTMERYPYFRVRMAIDGGDLVFEENPAPMPVLHTHERITLGSGQTRRGIFWPSAIPGTDCISTSSTGSRTGEASIR